MRTARPLSKISQSSKELAMTLLASGYPIRAFLSGLQWYFKPSPDRDAIVVDVYLDLRAEQLRFTDIVQGIDKPGTVIIIEDGVSKVGEISTKPAIGIIDHKEPSKAVVLIGPHEARTPDEEIWLGVPLTDVLRHLGFSCNLDGWDEVYHMDIVVNLAQREVRVTSFQNAPGLREVVLITNDKAVSHTCTSAGVVHCPIADLTACVKDDGYIVFLVEADAIPEAAG